MEKKLGLERNDVPRAFECDFLGVCGCCCAAAGCFWSDDSLVKMWLSDSSTLLVVRRESRRISLEWIIFLPLFFCNRFLIFGLNSITETRNKTMTADWLAFTWQKLCACPDSINYVSWRLKRRSGTKRCRVRSLDTPQVEYTGTSQDGRPYSGGTAVIASGCVHNESIQLKQGNGGSTLTIYQRNHTCTNFWFGFCFVLFRFVGLLPTLRTAACGTGSRACHIDCRRWEVINTTFTSYPLFLKLFGFTAHDF